MRESVIYQEMREEAREEAREVIRQEVRQEVREEVRQEERQEGERSLVLRLLTRKVGNVPNPMKAQIEILNLTHLEDLGEALLNFTTLADLDEWLAQVSQ
jgi:predicted transposase YdaD